MVDPGTMPVPLKGWPTFKLAVAVKAVIMFEPEAVVPVCVTAVTHGAGVGTLAAMAGEFKIATPLILGINYGIPISLAFVNPVGPVPVAPFKV